jgi:hypothetical protein
MPMIHNKKNDRKSMNKFIVRIHQIIIMHYTTITLERK